MSENMFGKALWLVGKENITLLECFGFADELVEYLSGEENSVLAINGDTHLAKFVRDEEPPEGWLENTMPGSKFTYFSFEMATLEGMTVVGATYTCIPRPHKS